MEDIPENIVEETVMKEFLYTITAEFDAMSDILADIEPHRISIENEKKLFEDDIYIQSYIIHEISTLTEKNIVSQN
ncbi:hypothetical protein [Thermosediminibacter litoriperuensis]|uniref:hypothetical protein n=1 Tax=Thermosediminibacter litoriperuensis TaxID=291989 RepID=UPI0011E80B4D|nr:hypothetical protein [Thermosediminibacter litoriperuensis]